MITYLTHVMQCLLIDTTFLEIDLRGIADLLDDAFEHRTLGNVLTLVKAIILFHRRSDIDQKQSLAQDNSTSRLCDRER